MAKFSKSGFGEDFVDPDDIEAAPPPEAAHQQLPAAQLLRPSRHSLLRKYE